MSYDKLSKKTGKLRVTILPIRVKKMFKGGEEAGITNVLHVNAEYNKDFQSHELITTACEKADLKIVFNNTRPKGWAVTNVSPKDLTKLIVKAGKHMLPKFKLTVRVKPDKMIKLARKTIELLLEEHDVESENSSDSDSSGESNEESGSEESGSEKSVGSVDSGTDDFGSDVEESSADERSPPSTGSKSKVRAESSAEERSPPSTGSKSKVRAVFKKSIRKAKKREEVADKKISRKAEVLRFGDTEVSGDLSGLFDDSAFAGATVVKVEDVPSTSEAHAAIESPPRTPPTAPRRKSVRAGKPKSRS